MATSEVGPHTRCLAEPPRGLAGPCEVPKRWLLYLVGAQMAKHAHQEQKA